MKAFSKFLLLSLLILGLSVAITQKTVSAESFFELESPAPYEKIIGKKIMIKAKAKNIKGLWLNGQKLEIKADGHVQFAFNSNYGKNQLTFLIQGPHKEIQTKTLSVFSVANISQNSQQKDNIADFITYYDTQVYLGDSTDEIEQLLSTAELAFLLCKTQKLFPVPTEQGKRPLSHPNHYLAAYLQTLFHHIPIKRETQTLNPNALVTRELLLDWIHSTYKNKTTYKIPRPKSWKKEDSPYQLVSRKEAFWVLSQVPSIKNEIAKFFKPINTQKISNRLSFISKKEKRKQTPSKKSTLKTTQKTSKVPIISYIVEAGDTLPRIAKKITGNSKNWEQIADFNNLEKIPGKKEGEFSCLIYIGQVLEIATTL